MQNPSNSNSRDRENFPSVEEFAEGIKNGDRLLLSRAITLIESNQAVHRNKAGELMDQLLQETGDSMRIAISGAPGVGKSSFLEKFGQYLVSEGLKVAILAIDPSSYRSGGSLLGDKTRMHKLSQSENVYIRPTAAREQLGGVARHTRETILLCEAADYDVVIVETVGVGQSEISAKFLVDIFVLLVLPGAGDELQGIKRGIVELADLLLITKADGDRIEIAKDSKKQYRNALQMLGHQESGWKTPTLLTSSISGDGIKESWKKCLEYREFHQMNDYWSQNRKEQIEYGLEQFLNSTLRDWFLQNEKLHSRYKKLKSKIIQGEISFSTLEEKIHQLLNNEH